MIWQYHYKRRDTYTAAEKKYMLETSHCERAGDRSYVYGNQKSPVVIQRLRQGTLTLNYGPGLVSL